VIRWLLLFLVAAPVHAQLALEAAPGANLYEKAKALYEQGAMPKGPEELKGWFAGRWMEADLPSAKGGLLGIEGVPSKREDPSSPEALILATWSDRQTDSWDQAKPAELTRSQEMVRKGPRDGVLTLDPAQQAAVVLGRYDDGKFRYEYAIRRVGEALLLRYDYEHRRISYGFYFRKVMP
jgi:hypothetical protein